MHVYSPTQRLGSKPLHWRGGACVDSKTLNPSKYNFLPSCMEFMKNEIAYKSGNDISEALQVFHPTLKT